MTTGVDVITVTQSSTKVIVSRLITVTTGAIDHAKMPVTQSNTIRILKQS